jgi:hypothetical protein
MYLTGFFDFEHLFNPQSNNSIIDCCIEFFV